MASPPVIVVTGLGLVLPVGSTPADVWRAAAGRQSGISRLTRLDAEGVPCTAGAEVPPFDLAAALRNPKNEKFIGASVRLGLRAALDAVAASGITASAVDPYRFGVYTGSGQTGLEPGAFFDALALAWSGSAEEDYRRLGGRASRLIDRYWSLRTLSNVGVGLLAMEIGARGPNGNFVQGDTASALALAAGCDDLREGRADVVLAGGYDSLLTSSSYLTYQRAGLLSSLEPSEAHRPFDRRRDGVVLGEGAAFFVLEREEDARRRGAPVLGELAGAACAQQRGDTASVKSSPDPFTSAATAALGAQAPAFVVSHGIGTPQDDRYEAAILSRTFPGAPVTAFKGLTGYLGAATAAAEFGLALLSLQHRVIPPIARCDTPDESCVVPLVAGEAQRVDGPRPAALCASWSWSGQCAALVARAVAPN